MSRARQLSARVRDLLPRRAEVAELSRDPLRNVIAGVTTGVVALPLALAFGVAAGLGAQVDMEASHLSQQLAVLRRTGLVVSRRVGSHVYYRLASERVAGLLAAARVLLTEVLAADVTLLDELEHSP